ncbi:MAG TPA: hypothetical protein DEE98_02500 [Elusimicrobia bacterium]|nr:MAG: hypothetical protein A2278_07330 [Elusimicrobia bacterium RIFOXYA12_FULL_49_49]OGS10023.1 MAG: hypothetical protein A2204_02335 [Elusimicrobia bacterium RIFOXYA1_FULL_47_7]OGS16121.1 MAG: hypothetical protein A2251_02935 [Elusimicrobia bacterium RIFOXYA2_FULL_47_53]OGS26747.1 MAG: hypothetical protein A2339_03985 [Elusimicrobia bacterium RIFOXYB12_FULL_50_12]OGS30127.1 MAG: hypothetical protein A2323_01600 [Elusimicrobia bacterium RIFOXYB2_FULL_46_23]HBU69234.1 hypothetical protein [El
MPVKSRKSVNIKKSWDAIVPALLKYNPGTIFLPISASEGGFKIIKSPSFLCKQESRKTTGYQLPLA